MIPSRTQLVVAADLALVCWACFCWADYPESLEVIFTTHLGRGALAVIVLAAHVQLVGGDLASVGLRLTPVQGWRYWGRMALVIGLVVAACMVVGAGAWVLLGQELPIYATNPHDLGASFLHMCVFAPVLEEATYRLALCVPLSAWRGPGRAIAVSGLAFGGLHVAYGNPSPANLVGGFFLAWAYLKSESIVVPVVLHGLGNLAALGWQVGVWYWLRGGA